MWRVPLTLRLPAAAAACAEVRADDPIETVLVYRMRGEVRPFLFWPGPDDVGGGHVVFRRSPASPTRRREEIEVLFGSEPERIPQRVNRWGYGLGSAEWVRDGNAAPRLLATEFKGSCATPPKRQSPVGP